MSSGETVGLVLLAVLCSVVPAVTLAVVIAERRFRKADQCVRRREAYASWLAARMTLSRASISFVSAFRALATEPIESKYAALRSAEAQRARSAWTDALKELDRTEAALIIWSGDPNMRDVLARFGRAEPEALRAAVNGNRSDVERLARAVHEQLEAVHTMVDEAMKDANSTPCPVRTWVLRTTVFVRRSGSVE